MAEALRHGVSFTPGGATTVEGRGQAGLRLFFSPGARWGCASYRR